MKSIYLVALFQDIRFSSISGTIEADVGADQSASTAHQPEPAAAAIAVAAAVAVAVVEEEAAAVRNNSVAAVAAAAVVPLFLAGRHRPRKSR